MAASSLSVLSPSGQRASPCGYCGASGETSLSYGARSPRLDCADYLSLCDAGWRRSGKYLYAPDHHATCCSLLTIRLDASRFAASPAQSRVLRRLNRWLKEGGSGGAEAVPRAEAPLAPLPRDEVASALTDALRRAVQAEFPQAAVASRVAVSRVSLSTRVPFLMQGGGTPTHASGAAFAVFAALAHGSVGAPTLQGVAERLARCAAALCSAPAVFEAAPSGHINIAVEEGHFAAEGGGAASSSAAPSRSSYARSRPPSVPPPAHQAPAPPAHTWRVITQPAAFEEAAYQLYVRYQVAVHGDTAEECSREQYTRFLCSSPLVRRPFKEGGRGGGSGGDGGGGGGGSSRPGGGSISGVGARGEPASRLAQRVAQATAERELAWGEQVGSLEPSPGAQGGGPSTAADGLSDPPTPPAMLCPDMPGGAQWAHGTSASGGGADDLRRWGYGSFHHRYLIDGVLVAVGVVDVLPRCLSSVYAFYDPIVARGAPAPAAEGSPAPLPLAGLTHGLELGKLTALREIQWVRDAQRVSPLLKHYYLGFFSPECPKMRYKGEYAPSELRCPTTRAWVPLAGALARLAAGGRHAPLADAAVAAADSNAAAALADRSGAALAAASASAIIAWAPYAALDDVALVEDLQAAVRARLRGVLRELLERLGVALGKRILVAVG